MTIILYLFFFFNDTATTEIYTLSLHDALPIWCPFECPLVKAGFRRETEGASAETPDTCRNGETRIGMQRFPLFVRVALSIRRARRNFFAPPLGHPQTTR